MSDSSSESGSRRMMSDSSSESGSRRVARDLALGLADGYRFRCGSCGNVTRFDVVERARTRRYHHYDLGGVGRVEEEEIIDRTVESVACRWCGRNDAIEVEPAPSAAAAGE
ncbi:MAG: hypothetical protein ACRDUY_02890 [Nitriliruptorales bacterium]